MTIQQMPPRWRDQRFAKRLRNCRMAWMSVLIAGVVFGSLGAIGSAIRASGPDVKPSDDPTRLFFAQHCQACHAGPKPKGNFRLERLSQDLSDKENRLRWQAVLEQVNAGSMLRDSKAKAFTENFSGQWLGLRAIDSTMPERMLYPEYDDILKVSMLKETLAPVVEDRLNAIEPELAAVKVELARVAAQSSRTRLDWLDLMEGSMSEYPEFDEMVRLGREYRKSFHPTGDND